MASRRGQRRQAGPQRRPGYIPPGSGPIHGPALPPRNAYRKGYGMTPFGRNPHLPPPPRASAAYLAGKRSGTPMVKPKSVPMRPALSGSAPTPMLRPKLAGYGGGLASNANNPAVIRRMTSPQGINQAQGGIRRRMPHVPQKTSAMATRGKAMAKWVARHPVKSTSALGLGLGVATVMSSGGRSTDKAAPLSPALGGYGGRGMFVHQ